MNFELGSHGVSRCACKRPRLTGKDQTQDKGEESKGSMVVAAY